MKKYMKFLFEDVSDVVLSSSTDSVDEQIDSLLYDIEREAVQEAMNANSTSGAEDSLEESVSLTKLAYLFEEDKPAPPPISVGTFANSIIRNLKLYEKVIDIPDIIDVPGVICRRARGFLKRKYGEKVENEFISILSKDTFASRYIDSKVDTSPDSPPNQPLAVGAMASGAGGA